MALRRDQGDFSSQIRQRVRAIVWKTLWVLRAMYAADAAITIGTMISAPIAELLLIAKIEVMLTC
jgi:hypothetical protein